MRKAIPPTLKRLILSALFATVAVSLSQASAIAAVYQQRSDYQQCSVIDFESLAIGAPAKTGTENWTAWTGSATTTGSAPRNTGNTSNVALTAPAATGASERQTGFSPVQGDPFTSSDSTLYFSAWFNRINNASSGARLVLDYGNVGSGGMKLGGFGVMDSSGSKIALWTWDSTANSGAGGPVWVQSDVSAVSNVWYEIALVIQIDSSDISKSLGSLYYRDVTSGQTDFTLVTFNNGATTSFEMSWFTSGQNARDSFAYWRYESFQGSAQIDNLATGVVVPEPSAALLGGCALLLLIPLFRNRLGRKS